MSRNGSGTYTVPNTFIPGTTITASGHNTNWSDIANEMTNSVAADGQTSMTGPLKFSNGAATAPSMTFASDTNTGWYRSAGDEMSLALGGSQKLVISTSDVTFGGVSLAALIGEVRIWMLPTAPTGWILMYGQACTTSYPLWRAALVAASNPYGTSGGDPLFPDMRGIVPAGKTTMGGPDRGNLTGGNTLGVNFGNQRITLTTNEIPAITPAGTISITDTGHVHSMGGVSATVLANQSGYTTSNPGGLNSSGASNTVSNTTGISATFNGTSFGGGAAHDNVQPVLIVNYIGRAA